MKRPIPPERRQRALARGHAAEDAARRFLEERGLQLVQSNYRSRHGEIDLVMDDGKSLVFVEVRFRRSDRFGSAAESVGGIKQARLTATALYYLQQNPRAAGRPARFDVVSIGKGRDGEPLIEWIQDAFQA